MRQAPEILLCFGRNILLSIDWNPDHYPGSHEAPDDVILVQPWKRPDKYVAVHLWRFGSVGVGLPR